MSREFSYTVFPLGSFSFYWFVTELAQKGLHAETPIKHSDPGFIYQSIAHLHPTPTPTHTHTNVCILTGVEEDHSLEADVLLPLELELSHSGRGSYQHIKDLHEALDAAPLFSAIQRHETQLVVYQEITSQFFFLCYL